MVGIDACFGLLMWFPDVPCSVDKAKERVDFLLESLEKRNERILIPAPALAEILVHAGTAGPAFVNEILKSGRFRVSPFDTKAAIEVAEQIATARKMGKKRAKGNADNWQKVKFDHQVVAICKTEEVSVLYSDDRGLANFARLNDIQVVSIADLPLPPSNAPLFDGIPELPEPPPAQEHRSTPYRLEAPKTPFAS